METQVKILPRKQFGLFFAIVGAVILALSVVLWYTLNPNVFYELAIYVGMVGAGALYFGSNQMFARKYRDGEVEISQETAKTFLLNNAIILSLLLLVVVIMVIEPRFMQLNVLLDILTMSSTKMIVALGICFTLLIAGTDLSAGRMVGLAAVVSTSMLQNPDYANRFFPDLPMLPVILPIL